MTYSIKQKFLRQRHGQLDILKDDITVVELDMRPFYFYKNGRYNFDDIRVPMYVDMKYESIVCTADIVSSNELHDKFFESLTFLLNTLKYDLTIISLFSKDLYDFYVTNYKQNKITIPENCTLLYSEESENIIRNWTIPSKIHFNLDELGEKAPKHFLMIVRNEALNSYKQKIWWDTEKEILDGEIA